MDDPLSQALQETPQKSIDPVPEVVEQHTAVPRDVHDVLHDIKEQAIAALALPFFDGGTADDVEPVVKVGGAEAGTVHVSARHLDPPYRADLTLYVRSDVESEHDGHYEVRARCEVSTERQERVLQPDQHVFAIGVTIGDSGALEIDVERLQAEMAAAIRSFRKTSQAP